MKLKLENVTKSWYRLDLFNEIIFLRIQINNILFITSTAKVTIFRSLLEILECHV